MTNHRAFHSRPNEWLVNTDYSFQNEQKTNYCMISALIFSTYYLKYLGIREKNKVKILREWIKSELILLFVRSISCNWKHSCILVCSMFPQSFKEIVCKFGHFKSVVLEKLRGKKIVYLYFNWKQLSKDKLRIESLITRILRSPSQQTAEKFSSFGHDSTIVMLSTTMQLGICTSLKFKEEENTGCNRYWDPYK